jgi:phosphoenolpyruvate synthase/pyruvate phosphate dikinase
MPGTYIHDLREAAVPPSIGNKAAHLRFLMRHRLPVPPTLVCTWDAYLHYQAEGATVLEKIRSELASRLDGEHRYAVRSSANVEDDLGHSFAGQFQTFLDVRGMEEILRAIELTWKSTQSPGIQAYLAHHAIPSERLRMAVLIQEMVHPHISGVSFSRNPMTGLGEVIVEAIQGRGDALVQEGATPPRWISKWGTWLQKAEADGIGLDLIEEVVRGTKAIAKAYGNAVDLEWVYDGHGLYWVQLREITALDIPIYSNRISREVFPGIIRPLIWSVNVPLVNGAWVRLFTELIGPNDIDPESLAGCFYYRAYFDMAALGQVFELLGLPRETLELLLGLEIEGPEKPRFKPSPRTYALLPRMLRFGLEKLRFSHELDPGLPSLQERFRALRAEQPAVMSETELLDAIDRLFRLAQEAAYYDIVTPLLMAIYNQILKGQMRRVGVEFEELDVTAGMEELHQFEPGVHLARLHQHYAALTPALQASVMESSYKELGQIPDMAPLFQAVERFLEQFGHLSDSGNDFSAVPWREKPELILRMIADYEAADSTAGRRLRFEEIEMSSARRLLLQPIYRRARHYRWYREAVSSLYTYGYGLFRAYFLALGDRFVQRGVLKSRDDIFYLYFPEVRQAVECAEPTGQYQAMADQRKAEIESVREVEVPEIIYGSQAPPVQARDSRRLQGVATSRGHHVGPVKVLKGLEDFGKVEAGDVLVIPYSDVGWTPLFARAGAVVAESGGMLSHSSIIAREYNIPAVVSVPGACRLADGTVVSVDGYRGQVIIHAAA